MSKPFKKLSTSSNLSAHREISTIFYPVSSKDRELCNKYKCEETLRGKVARNVLVQDRISAQQMGILRALINWHDLSNCNFTEKEYSDEDYEITSYDLCVDGNG